jgi:hypothetical protein
MLGSERLAEGDILGSNVLHFFLQVRGIATRRSLGGAALLARLAGRRPPGPQSSCACFTAGMSEIAMPPTIAGTAAMT